MHTLPFVNEERLMLRLVRIFCLIVLVMLRPDVSSAQNQQTKRVDPVQGSKTLDQLIESLNAESIRKRQRAIETLRSMGPSALPALPALMRALDDDSISIRIAAAQTLGSFGPAGKDALPKLAAQLYRKEVWLVESVAMAIGFIGGPQNKPAVRRLLILTHPKFGNALIHDSYLRTFTGTALTHLIELLNDENVVVREQSAIAIGSIVHRIGKQEPLLSKTDVKRDDLGPPLIAILNDENLSVRIAAAHSLFHLDQKHCRLLIPTAIDALSQRQMRSYDAVEFVRPVANEAVPFLIAALDHKDDWTQQQIAATIAAMPTESLPHLAKASTHESSRVRAGVAFTLGHYPFRKLNRQAASALIPFLRDENAEVRLRGAEAISGLHVENADATVPVLIGFLNDKQAMRRIRAAKALSNTGPAACAAVPALLTTLSDEDQNVGIHAAIALVSIDKSQGPATLSTLEAAIKPLDNNVGYRRRSLQEKAVVAVGNLGPAADQLAGTIAATLQKMPTDRRNAYFQLVSAEALIKISNSKAHLGVRKLAELAACVKGSTREYAIEALVRQAQHAKPAIDAILAVAIEDRGSYREEAVVAAIKIDPENAEGWKLLHQMFEKEDSLEIDRVLTALVKFDVNARCLLADLERILGETRSATTLVNSITVIGNARPGAKSAVSALTKLLTHEKEAVQQAARRALEKIQSGTANPGIH